MKAFKTGYISGIFDLLNADQLDILCQAKDYCETLVVGVLSDDIHLSRNNTMPISNITDRLEIISAIRYVDKVIVQKDEDYRRQIREVGTDVIFFVREEEDKVPESGDLTGISESDCSIIFLFPRRGKIDNILGDRLIFSDRVPWQNNLTIGYTTGVFDMFHIGHLNILRRARERCDKLIVGVSTDELVQSYKNKTPLFPFEERLAIVSCVKYVDAVVAQETMDKYEAWTRFHYNKMFHGDDWKGSSLYNQIEERLKAVGVETCFLPHTEGVSSSLLRGKVLNKE